MEKLMKFFALCFFFSATLFADHIILKNETSFSKIAVQWASSARMAQESNDTLMQRNPIPPASLSHLHQNKETVSIPKNTAYFRVLIWNSAQKYPEFLTNWVELVPGKSYLLKEEHLTPLLLLNGMGC